MFVLSFAQGDHVSFTFYIGTALKEHVPQLEMSSTGEG